MIVILNEQAKQREIEQFEKKLKEYLKKAEG